MLVGASASDPPPEQTPKFATRSGPRLGKIVKILIVTFWAIMAFLLIQRTHLVPEVTIQEKEQLPDTEEWRSVLFKGRKIGYSVQSLTRVGNGYIFEDKAFMHLNLMGTVQDLRTLTSARLSNSLGLQSFSFFMSTGAIRYQLTGTLTGLDLELISATGGAANKSTLRLPEVPRLAGVLTPYLLQKGLEKGQRFKVPIFDPATLGTRDVVVLVEDQEKLTLDGQVVETFRIRQDYVDTKTYVWVDKDGRVLREEGLMGLAMVRSTEAQAKADLSGRADLPDLITATSVPTNRVIDEPRQVGYLKARLKGVKLGGMELGGGRQRLDGDVIEITREIINPEVEQRVAAGDPLFKSYLRAPDLGQPIDPKVAAKARAVAAGSGPLEATHKVVNWVYQNLEKRPTMSVPDPATILETKVGDCNEHAALAGAMLQALGIPVKTCVGVLYFQGGFFYHAWLEVYFGQWLAVDPLLGQIPADATHIRLLTGGLSRQTELIRVIGRLEIEILEVR